MASIPLFSSVPGQAVPGMSEPGLIAQAGSGGGTFLFYGHFTLDYLDYLDSSSGHTLVAAPGNFYSMTVVNPRAGLTVPPPDGRWNPGTVRDLLVFRPHGGAHFRLPPPFAPGPSLSEARAAAGPGLVPPPYIPVQAETPVAPGGRLEHRAPASAVAEEPSLAETRARIGPGPQEPPRVTVQPGVAPEMPVSLAEARARVGPGVVPPPLVPAQPEPAADQGAPRFQHQAPPSAVAPPLSLAEVRAAIEAAKASR